MNAFTKAQPGQPMRIPAAAYNAMLAAAEAYSFGNSLGGPGRGSARAPHILRLKNATGAAVQRFSVLGIGAPIIEASTEVPGSGEEEYDIQAKFFANCNAFSGVAPVFADHEKRWCITLESIPAGEFGAAAILGVFPCLVSVGAETDPEAKVINADKEKLESCESGGTADILWKESGTGTKWALVYVRPFGATGGTLDIVQAVADGTLGAIPAKLLTLKADLSASPNYTLAASATTLGYFKL